MEAGQYLLTSPRLMLEDQGSVNNPTLRLWPPLQIPAGAAPGAVHGFVLGVLHPL
jgi:hypothetical protein